MNSLKSIVTEKDTWNVSDGEYNGNLFILRYRPNLQAFTETREYSTRFTIIWEFESDNSILPEETQLEVMVKVEDELVNALENDLHTVLAFIYTSQNKKEWHWYSKSVDETGKRVNRVLAQFELLPIKLFLENDPDWIEYTSVIESAADATTE